jgi:hypothetical protein
MMMFLTPRLSVVILLFSVEKCQKRKLAVSRSHLPIEKFRRTHSGGIDGA